MRLAAGSSLGPYRIDALIGAGGMGEVYRGHDARLERDVAIKLLPEHLAEDAERRARFEREARTLASLNHPHIAHVYGFESDGDVHALVMELVGGPSLSEVIRTGAGPGLSALPRTSSGGPRPLPLPDALEIARQIALALDAAHEKGIVHRDLKPANIKLAPDGTVKVLDFGLAKLHAPPGESGELSSSLANSPTFTSPVMATEAGMLLGTAAYMSPEQARGLPVDKRADIWAFGLVLYEMLTGRAAFSGDTVTDTLAAVLRGEPDWEALPAGTPEWVRRLLRRCLDRDPKHRLRDIGDAVVEIEEARGSDTVAASSPAARAQRWTRHLPWAAAFITGAAATLALVTIGRPARAPAPVMAFDVALADADLFTSAGAALALAPDGTSLAYVINDGAESRDLRIKGRAERRSREIVQGASVAQSPYQPFFSPSGDWLGYTTATELRKVSVLGGTAIRLCTVDRPRGMTWLPDDTIVFAQTPQSGLSRVSAAGGEPAAVTTLDASREEVSHRWPFRLPGGRAVLFTVSTNAVNWARARIEALTLDTGERKVIVEGGSYGRYVPSGHLLYMSRGTLFAVPFDPERLEVSGTAIPVVQDVSWSEEEGFAHFDVTDDGMFAYLPGTGAPPQYPIDWVTRDGKAARLTDRAGAYGSPRLSPDGRKLALTVLRDNNWDVWTYDIDRAVMTRITPELSAESEPVWSNDGRTLFYTAARGGRHDVFARASDGSGDERQITSGQQVELFPMSATADGRTLYAVGGAGGTQQDLFQIDIATGVVSPVVESRFQKTQPSISPDGRWLAYDSAEQSRREVFVRSVQGTPMRWQVSQGGGGQPQWTKGGRELVFRTSDGVMAASVEREGDGLRIGRPVELFSGRFLGGVDGITSLPTYNFTDFAVSADGSRFVMFPRLPELEAANRATVAVVTSWFATLEDAGSRTR